ncbi:HDOD domain-containing protein [Shewanella yunxiaonensis]|uniref:HDOD domain-containing protein n=1 Tax=Shewanella yunxiaonensis TaxID=2829809 RepID=A0ABX7YYD2_9GAMM|nr:MULTISPECIES: HDOD domain-containing protein [Shewanella]MDF0535352.1 HDOD domain-containing protein [Shewanella sp. A32]QUN07463.1 HDOD domain-containing protein [Shewanella yunxiaonensis]
MGIFKKLFNIRDDINIERPQSFSGAPTPIAQELHKVSQHVAMVSADERLEASVDATALFYSLLFSVGKDSGGVANALERRVLAAVEQALMSPQQVAANVLKLPGRIMELDRKLSDPEFCSQDIVKIIQQDPVLSADVIQACNAPVFRRSERSITNLPQALVVLGSERLRRIVTTCMMKEMIAIKPIYFRRFGAQLWRHSLQVAFLAGELDKQHSDTAFMVGLLHDVGKIAIFKLLLDVFNQTDPSEQPKSWLFRQVMTARSLELSSLLVSCWQLPATFAETLSPLASSLAPAAGLSRVVWQANVISECSMLYEEGRLAEPLLDNLLSEIALSPQQFLFYHNKIKEIK